MKRQLVPYLVPLTVAGVSRAMAVWLTRRHPSRPSPKCRSGSLYLSRTLEDRYVSTGRSTRRGAVVTTALRLATADRSDLPSHPAARRADALVEICCRFFLDHQQAHAGGQHRPHVNVVVEPDDLLSGRGAQVVDGPMLDGPTVSRLFCDSAVHRVVMSGRSSILDYGTSTRTIPAPLWNALVM